MAIFRLWAKEVLKRLHLAASLNLREYCKECGRAQPLVWRAPDELWAEVRKMPVNLSGGVLCPECFDRRADAMGILLMWEPREELRPATGGRA